MRKKSHCYWHLSHIIPAQQLHCLRRQWFKKWLWLYFFSTLKAWYIQSKTRSSFLFNAVSKYRFQIFCNSYLFYEDFYFYYSNQKNMDFSIITFLANSFLESWFILHKLLPNICASCRPFQMQSWHPVTSGTEKWGLILQM